MKKTIILAIALSMLLCLPAAAYAQDGEGTTAADTEELSSEGSETDASGDTQITGLPDYMLRENNFIMDSYDVSEDIRNYMDVREGDQIVRIFKSLSYLDSMFASVQLVDDDLISSMVDGEVCQAYVVRRSDGSVTQKEITKDNILVEGNIADLPDAIWSYDMIRKLDPNIKVEKACVLHYNQLSGLSSARKVFLIYYKTDLGDYVYYRQPSNPYSPSQQEGEYLFPVETFCNIQKELYDRQMAEQPANGDIYSIGYDEYSITDSSVDLTTYDIHSANFHIDVPERPHTGLYIALGIGGGLVLVVVVVAVLLGIQAKKRRTAREI